VLLHGGPGMSASCLDPLLPLLTGPFAPILHQQRGLPPTPSPSRSPSMRTSPTPRAVIEQAVGGRAWIVGHSWGGHLALHVLVACPERVAGAIIIDPLGAHLEVMEEFGERMEAPLNDEQRARVAAIEAKEEAGTATAEESLEALRLVWPSYFADPPKAPPMPDIELTVPTFTATMASAKEHAEAETLVRGLPAVPAEIPVLFVHGAGSPMPMRASTETAKLIPHAEVEVLEGAGHFIWHERPGELRDVVSAFAGR
jgi:proline iminopeptidase